MHYSDLLTLTLFLAAAHRSHARPQNPPPVPTPCLTTIDIGFQQFVLVATPTSNLAILEIASLSVDTTTSTSVIGTTTLTQNGDTIVPIPEQTFAFALNGNGNIVLDGNEKPFDATMECPRFIHVSAVPNPEPAPTGVLFPPVVPPTGPTGGGDQPEEDPDQSGGVIPPLPPKEECFPPCVDDICPDILPPSEDDPCLPYFLAGLQAPE